MTAVKESALSVEVFTAPSCGPCAATKRALDSRRIPYQEHPAANYRSFLLHLGARSLPVVIIYRDGHYLRHWTGYSADMIDALGANIEEES